MYSNEIIKCFAHVQFFLNKLFTLQQDLIEKRNRKSPEKEDIENAIQVLGEIIKGIMYAIPMPSPTESWYEVSKEYREWYDYLEKTSG